MIATSRGRSSACEGGLCSFARPRSGAGVEVGSSESQFLRWFDLMGVQRHLKAIGIFARLWHRDGKPGYLNDIPRTLNYVRAASGRLSRAAVPAVLHRRARAARARSGTRAG